MPYFCGILAFLSAKRKRFNILSTEELHYHGTNRADFEKHFVVNQKQQSGLKWCKTLRSTAQKSAVIKSVSLSCCRFRPKKERWFNKLS